MCDESRGCTVECGTIELAMIAWDDMSWIWLHRLSTFSVRSALSSSRPCSCSVSILGRLSLLSVAIASRVARMWLVSVGPVVGEVETATGTSGGGGLGRTVVAVAVVVGRVVSRSGVGVG